MTMPTTLPTRALRGRGFTLMELMIVITVLAIVAAVAIPSYRESVARSARANAAGELLAAQQWMERFYSENFRYDANRVGTPITDASQFPAHFSQSPRPGEGNARYRITITAQRQAYVITATRVAPGAMAGDACGDLRIDHVGRREVVNWNTGRFADVDAAVAQCWRM